MGLGRFSNSHSAIDAVPAGLVATAVRESATAVTSGFAASA